LQKEYRKLTAAQFRAFADSLSAFQAMAADLKDLIKTVPAEKWKSLLVGDVCWSWVCELPYSWHISTAIYVMNLGEWLKEVAASPDPQQRVLDDMRPDVPLPSEDFHPDVDEAQAFGIVMSMIYTMHSIAMYGRSLSGLIAEVRDHDDLDCLFRAVKVDRRVLTCATVANRIAVAELVGDKKFFTRLSNALKGPSQKEWAGLAKMKLSFLILRELEINDLSDAALEQLMVHTLDAYQHVPGARKHLRIHYLNSRKLKTI